MAGDDFFALQNYTRFVYGPEGQISVPGTEMTQAGYEYAPAALEAVVRAVAAEIDLPLLITENGMATDEDPPRQTQRPPLRRHRPQQHPARGRHRRPTVRELPQHECRPPLHPADARPRHRVRQRPRHRRARRRAHARTRRGARPPHLADQRREVRARHAPATRGTRPHRCAQRPQLEAKRDEIFVAPSIGIVPATLDATALEHQKRLVPELRRRGVRLLPGGDYGFPFNPNGRNARDLALWVEHFGYTAADALSAATNSGWSARVSWPTCCWWTATRRRTSPCCRTSTTCGRSCRTAISTRHPTHDG